jgi:hypothetical protein
MTEYPYPPIDYLARDYNSLRQMLLDRLSLQLPNWTERHEADIGITLVELLAYVGDYLSYYQDAVGAEAYLATARQRISLRRHARLLDYMLGEGLNARAFVSLETAEDNLAIPVGTPLLTQTTTFDTSVPRSLMKTYDGVVFETMHNATLFRASNSMTLHTPGSENFSLLTGATSAKLVGALSQLQIGDVLILQPSNSVGAGLTSTSASAHPIRIAQQPVITLSPSGPITTISWFEADALPTDFPVTIRQSDGQILTNCTTVLGNIVLADEGRTTAEQLAPVPLNPEATPFNLKLVNTGIAHAVPYVHADALLESAGEALIQNLQQACALISLEELPPADGHVDRPSSCSPAVKPSRIQTPIHQARLNARDLRSNRVPPIHLEPRPQSPPEGHLPANLIPRRVWTPRQDLLSSFGYSPDFVAEIDNDGAACLRFGDGINGRKPAPGTVFRATCRTGQGTAGNVAVDAIAHIVGFDKRILSVQNPLPATGAQNPDDPAQVRLNAPHAFASQRRCITTDDYVAMACSFPGIGAATATRTWNASTPAAAPDKTVYSTGATVTILAVREDRTGISEATAERLVVFLQAFAYMGDQLVVSAPTPVPRRLRLQVAVAPGYQTSLVHNQVKAAVEAKLQLTRFDLGQIVRVSPLIAAATAVPGVLDVSASFQISSKVTPRVDELNAPIDTDVIDPGPQGIAQIDSLDVSPALPRERSPQ